MQYTDYMIGRLVAWGYMRTSRRYGIISRIDRPDWREYMAYKHSPWDPLGQGMDWVNGLGYQAAEHYCRTYSQDRIEGVPLHVSDQLCNGATAQRRNGATEYSAKPDEKPRIEVWQAATRAQGRRRWQCTGVTGKRAYGPTIQRAYDGLMAMPAGA